MNIAFSLAASGMLCMSLMNALAGDDQVAAPGCAARGGTAAAEPVTALRSAARTQANDFELSLTPLQPESQAQPRLAGVAFAF